MGKEKTMLRVSALTLLGLGAGFYLLWKDPALSTQLVGAALVFVSTIAAAVAALIQWCCCAQRGPRDPRPTQSGGPKATKLKLGAAQVGAQAPRLFRRKAAPNPRLVVFQDPNAKVDYEISGNPPIVKSADLVASEEVQPPHTWTWRLYLQDGQLTIAHQQTNNSATMCDQNGSAISRANLYHYFEIDHHIIFFTSDKSDIEVWQAEKNSLPK